MRLRKVHHPGLNRKWHCAFGNVAFLRRVFQISMSRNTHQDPDNFLPSCHLNKGTEKSLTNNHVRLKRCLESLPTEIYLHTTFPKTISWAAERKCYCCCSEASQHTINSPLFTHTKPLSVPASTIASWLVESLLRKKRAMCLTLPWLNRFHLFVEVFELAKVPPIEARLEFILGSFLKRAVELAQTPIAATLNSGTFKQTRQYIPTRIPHSPQVHSLPKLYAFYLCQHQ